MKYLIPIACIAVLAATVLPVHEAEARSHVHVGMGFGMGHPGGYYPYPSHRYYDPYRAYPVYVAPQPYRPYGYYEPPPPVSQDRYYESEQGEYCREYTHTVVVGNQREQAYGHACREEDGSWRIVD